MNITQIVFSPTGGTQKIADIISCADKNSITKIDISDPNFDCAEIEKNSIAVIAVPSFGGRVPHAAVERIRKIKGNAAKCIIICVYGNRAYDDTLLELSDTAEESGFIVIAAVAAVAEHSIVRRFACGRPDEKDKKQLEAFAQKIFDKINNGSMEFTSKISIPGQRPYKEYGGVGFVPKAGKNCAGCGLCAPKCPVSAISKDSIKTADSAKCISCMRCVSLCPHSARQVNKVMLSAASLALKKACSARKENELFM